jgi:hypothetical protein
MAECVYCIHARTNPITGRISCDSAEAKEELGEERVQRYTSGGEHDCPHFEDDELPW